MPGMLVGKMASITGMVMMMVTAVASSNIKYKYENHCGRNWNIPFVTTVIRLDIDFIETSFFNGNKLSLGIQRFFYFFILLLFCYITLSLLLMLLLLSLVFIFFGCMRVVAPLFNSIMLRVIQIFPR